MRDLILLSAVAAFAALTLRRPFAGLLAWAWFTLMTPHQLAYGVYGVPLNVVIALATLGAYILSGEAFRFRLDAVSGWILALALWVGVSQAFSLDAENSREYADRFLKTLLFALLCAQMARDRLRLHALLWMLVLGLGFFAAKGAAFTLATLGQFRVQGLPDTVLADNNHFAIATASVLPLMLYLAGEAKTRWLRAGLIVLFAMSVFAVIGTHSRGGLIALVVFAGAYWLRARRKFAIAAGLVALAIPAVLFMPAKWTDRMATIGHATQDESFTGRVDAWIVNWKLALAHPATGAGLRNSYERDVAASVDPERALTARAAHSIYFEILGGTGFVGLAIYLALFGSAFLAALGASRRAARGRAPPWAGDLGRALRISLFVFAIGGASVSMEMWDGYLIVIALAAALCGMQPRAVTPVGHALKRLGRARKDAGDHPAIGTA